MPLLWGDYGNRGPLCHFYGGDYGNPPRNTVHACCCSRPPAWLRPDNGLHGPRTPLLAPQPFRLLVRDALWRTLPGNAMPPRAMKRPASPRPDDRVARSPPAAMELRTPPNKVRKLTLMTDEKDIDQRAVHDALSERRVRQLKKQARELSHYVPPEKRTAQYALSLWSNADHVALVLLTMVLRQLYKLNPDLRRTSFQEHSLSIMDKWPKDSSFF